MIRMTIVLSNRVVYRVMNSVWAACMYGISLIKECHEILVIYVSDAETGEVYKRIFR